MKADPELNVISRDEIFVRLPGSVHTDSYSGAGHRVYGIMERLLRRKLATQTMQLDLLGGYFIKC